MESEVALIRPDEDGYPQGLRDLERPPPIYVVGRLTEQPAVAVVGTRRCTRYGLELSRAFGMGLSSVGWTVVSGLARGIDAGAHEGALEVDGHVVGVLGSGVDVWYPAENRPLYRRLLRSGGALISEYPPGTQPDRWRFPARNRLIAAAASATVVVEAGQTGGALITARLSAELGRPVFVVPGDVDREASAGANRLIRDGAHPVFGPDDLIEELSLALGRPHRTQRRGILLPENGVDIADLPDLWDCDPGEALRRLGELELEGRVRRVGERVLPITDL